MENWKNIELSRAHTTENKKLRERDIQQGIKYKQ